MLGVTVADVVKQFVSGYSVPTMAFRLRDTLEHKELPSLYNLFRWLVFFNNSPPDDGIIIWIWDSNNSFMAR